MLFYGGNKIARRRALEPGQVAIGLVPRVPRIELALAIKRDLEPVGVGRLGAVPGDVIERPKLASRVVPRHVDHHPHPRGSARRQELIDEVAVRGRPAPCRRVGRLVVARRVRIRDRPRVAEGRVDVPIVRGVVLVHRRRGKDRREIDAVDAERLEMRQRLDNALQIPAIPPVPHDVVQRPAELIAVEPEPRRDAVVPARLELVWRDAVPRRVPRHQIRRRPGGVVLRVAVAVSLWKDLIPHPTHRPTRHRVLRRRIDRDRGEDHGARRARAERHAERVRVANAQPHARRRGIKRQRDRLERRPTALGHREAGDGDVEGSCDLLGEAEVDKAPLGINCGQSRRFVGNVGSCFGPRRNTARCASDGKKNTYSPRDV